MYSFWKRAYAIHPFCCTEQVKNEVLTMASIVKHRCKKSKINNNGNFQCT